jgi:hypothetical protein
MKILRFAEARDDAMMLWQWRAFVVCLLLMAVQKGRC